MAAALAGAAGDNRILMRAELLAQAGQAIILAAKTDDGMSIAPDRADRGGHAVGAQFDLKTL